MAEFHQVSFVAIVDQYARLEVPWFVTVSHFCPAFWCVSLVFEVH